MSLVLEFVLKSTNSEAGVLQKLNFDWWNERAPFEARSFLQQLIKIINLRFSALVNYVRVDHGLFYAAVA